MISIQVCVGSSCHLKGAHDVVQAFKREISSRKLDQEVFLTGAFCLGRCIDGVSIKIDDELIFGRHARKRAGDFPKQSGQCFRRLS